jgi:hypothetical protein
LVRRVRSEGPQHVTVHGRDEVVVIAAEEFRRLKGDLTGQALVAVMQASPHRDIDIAPRRAYAGARRRSLTGWPLAPGIYTQTRRKDLIGLVKHPKRAPASPDGTFAPDFRTKIPQRCQRPTVSV